MTISGWVILAVIIALILIAVGIWFIRSFYHRSSKEIAFVRTGLGGQKVIIDGAAFVFPIFHKFENTVFFQTPFFELR